LKFAAKTVFSFFMYLLSCSYLSVSFRLPTNAFNSGSSVSYPGEYAFNEMIFHLFAQNRLIKCVKVYFQLLSTVHCKCPGRLKREKEHETLAGAMCTLLNSDLKKR